MKVWYSTPFAVDRNLGRAYNEEFAKIADDDWMCIRDGDTMFLTPDFGDVIFNYAYQNPGCVMTCYTNRIHRLATGQMIETAPIENPDVTTHINVANFIARTHSVSKVAGPLSGFLMLIPKSVWNKVSFREGIGLLGVDTNFYKDLLAAGIPIMRMDGLYVFHSYRLGKDIKDTTHLRT